MVRLRIVCLRQFEFFLVRQQVSAAYLAFQAKKRQLFLRPFENVKINLTWPGRNYSPRKFVRDGARTGTVDCFAVHLEPIADLRKPFDARLRDDTFRGRADVQQIVPVAAADHNELPDQDRRRFPVGIVFLKSPRVVDRYGGFPVTFYLTDADLVIARRVVITQAVADPSRYKAIWLDRMNKIDQLLAVLAADVAWRVEPDQPYRAVVRQQLAHLRLDLFFQVFRKALFALVRKIPVIADRVGLMPVLRLRVVEADLDPGLMSRVRKLFHRVPFERSCVVDVVLTNSGPVHRKTVMVLGGDHDVLHPRVLGEPNYLLGVEFHRIEPRRQLLVFRDRDLCPVHYPLAEPGDELSLPLTFRHGVEPPMNKHSKPQPRETT